MKFSASDLMKSVATVESRLSDDMSKQLYELRLKYFFNRNRNEFCNEILNLGLEWQIPALDEMYRINDQVKSLVLFGSGEDGKYALKLLQHSKYKNEKILFCDNNQMKWNAGGGGDYPEIISPDELIENYRESIVIICIRAYKTEIYEQLILGQHYPRERILYTRSLLYGKRGNQYFDYFEPKTGEIFVDGGCYNGRTAVEFTKWAAKGYDYIYSFEADSHLIKKCKRTFKEYELKGELVEKGLWDKKEILNFSVKNSTAGSKITKTGEVKIETTALDEILNGKPATFIKMDIEGAEFKALLGAEKTIKKYRPRLAISIYHKPEDILEIPALLLNMQPDYQFALRQYATDSTETILYAY